jgi:hypothetical protein
VHEDGDLLALELGRGLRAAAVHQIGPIVEDVEQGPDGQEEQHDRNGGEHRGVEGPNPFA